jgi:hypothetical protein
MGGCFACCVQVLFWPLERLVRSFMVCVLFFFFFFF